MMKVDVEDHSFFVVRAATNSISDLLDCFNQVHSRTTQDYLAILEKWLMEPWNQKGLLLASPDLYEAWQAQSSNLQAASSTFKALWRYMLRSYSRATPFGLYAGAGVGHLDNQTVIDFGSEPWQQVSRPDATLYNSLTQALINDQSVRKQLSYSLNNSVYQIDQEFRFSQSVPESTSYKIILTSYSVSEELTLIVERLTQQSTLTYEQLLALFTEEEQPLVESFIDQLIESQFLSSSLLLPVTGQDWMSRLISLAQIQQLSSPLLIDLISTINEFLNLDPSIDSLLKSHNKLKRINEQVEENSTDYRGSMIQTDLVFKPLKLSLDQTLVHQIAQQFLRILPLLRVKNDIPITNFIQRFRARYQDETVDLLTVLDPEYGIGFNERADSESILLKQIPFSTQNESKPIAPSALVKLIYDRFCLTGEMEITITEEDIKSQLNDQPNYPNPISFYLFGELYQQMPGGNDSVSKPDIISTGNKWFFTLKTGTTSSSAFLLGRFCLNDPALATYVREMCAWEQMQYPDDLLAEVVHAPPTPKRARNVVSRPVLRMHEIPYLTPAGTLSDQVINLTNVCVRVTETGEIQLFHKHTGQRIRPRLTTAHKITLGDDIYQFLGYAEQLESNRYGWQWGYFQDQPSLPRITYQNLILQQARWTIRKEVFQSPGPITFQQIIQLYKLPRYVQLVELDLMLLLDLELAPCQEILQEELEKNGLVRLREWLSSSFQPWLTDQDRAFISELIIPMKGPASVNKNQSHLPFRLPIQTTSDILRTIYPGTSWLYYKIYVSELTADYFLTNNLSNITTYLLTKGWCHQFFFIRYADPDFHLRIRFLAHPSFVGDLLEACNNFFTPSATNSIVHRFAIDTYQRELERYTPTLMGSCETIFSQDSRMVLRFLSSEEETLKTDLDRYAFAVASVDNLLDNFLFTLDEKRKFCQVNQHNYWKEEGSQKAVKKSLNTLYRHYAESLFEPSQVFRLYFEQRLQELQTTFETINRYYQDSDSSITKEALLSSIIHMHVNRLFSVQQRRHELIIYHFLARHYESRVARSKNTFLQ